MCGRFTIQYSWAEIHAQLDSFIPKAAAGRNDPPCYNVAPTQDVGFVCEQDGERVVKDGRWWLVPFWAKEVPKYPMFNARSETAAKKPSFREAFKSKRCLIPAGGYYEWTKADDGGKDPHHIHLPDQAPFFFAGLWAHNDSLNIISCTILTAPAAPEIAHLHDRMPIILKHSALNEWLNTKTSVDDAHSLLVQNHGSSLKCYRVGRVVNSSRAKGAELMEPISNE